MIDLATRVTVPESVLFRDLDGEAVLLETGSGRYYGLDEVGTRMWSLLQLHGEIEAVCRALLAEYDVPEDRLREDLAAIRRGPRRARPRQDGRMSGLFGVVDFAAPRIEPEGFRRLAELRLVPGPRRDHLPFPGRARGWPISLFTEDGPAAPRSSAAGLRPAGRPARQPAGAGRPALPGQGSGGRGRGAAPRGLSRVGGGLHRPPPRRLRLRGLGRSAPASSLRRRSARHQAAPLRPGRLAGLLRLGRRPGPPASGGPRRLRRGGDRGLSGRPVRGSGAQLLRGRPQAGARPPADRGQRQVCELSATGLRSRGRSAMRGTRITRITSASSSSRR